MIFHERSREATAFKNRLKIQAFYGILPGSEQTNNQGMTDATTIDYIKQKNSEKRNLRQRKALLSKAARNGLP